MEKPTTTSPKLCDGCGAIGVSCCRMSRTRLEMANQLSAIVDRQRRALDEMKRERDEARQVIADLRRTAAA